MTDLEMLLATIQKFGWAYTIREITTSTIVEIKNVADDEIDFSFNKITGKTQGFSVIDNTAYSYNQGMFG